MTGKTRNRRAAGRALDAAFGDTIDSGIAEALARDRATGNAGDEEADDPDFDPDGGDPEDEDDLADRNPSSDGAAAALARAGVHARRSAAEAVLAARALLDAGALAATGQHASATAGLARMADGLDALASSLGGDRPANEALLGAVSEAIDAEIARWEARASNDPEARAVLRAWLGLRELLWEVGVRRKREPQASRSRESGTAEQNPTDPIRQSRRAASAQKRTTASREQRIQRVPLEG